jgi:hypothetical protein
VIGCRIQSLQFTDAGFDFSHPVLKFCHYRFNLRVL